MHPDRLLRRTLSANALVSATWGVVVLLLADALVGPLGADAVVARVFGVVAVVAALLFGVRSRRPTLRPADGWLAATGDVAFGVTLVVLAVASEDLTTAGRWLTAGSGLATIDLGLVEAVGTRRLSRSAPPSPVPGVGA